MVTLVDVLDFVINKVVGLDHIPDDKKERLLEVIIKSATEGFARGLRDEVQKTK